MQPRAQWRGSLGYFLSVDCAATSQTKTKHSNVVLFTYNPGKICEYHRWMSPTTPPLIAVFLFCLLFLEIDVRITRI